MISTLWSVVPWPHLLELPRKIQCFGQFCFDGVSMFSSDYCSCGVSFLGVSESLECRVFLSLSSSVPSGFWIRKQAIRWSSSPGFWTLLWHLIGTAVSVYLILLFGSSTCRSLLQDVGKILCAQWLTDDNLSDYFFFLAATIGREDLRCTCQVSLICGCMCTPR
jgi:hypothetical protein